MRRGWYARDRFPHRWCSAVAVCLPPRPQTTRSTGPAGSLITARTRRQGRTRENTSRTSPTFATRTPPVVMPKPLRVSRIQARLSLRDRNRGVPNLAALTRTGQGVEPVPVPAARVLTSLHQSNRRDAAQPPTLRCGLGQGRDPALHLRV